MGIKLAKAHLYTKVTPSKECISYIENNDDKGLLYPLFDTPLVLKEYGKKMLERGSLSDAEIKEKMIKMQLGICGIRVIDEVDLNKSIDSDFKYYVQTFKTEYINYSRGVLSGSSRLAYLETEADHISSMEYEGSPAKINVSSMLEMGVIVDSIPVGGAKNCLIYLFHDILLNCIHSIGVIRYNTFGVDRTCLYLLEKSELNGLKGSVARIKPRCMCLDIVAFGRNIVSINQLSGRDLDMGPLRRFANLYDSLIVLQTSLGFRFLELESYNSMIKKEVSNILYNLEFSEQGLNVAILLGYDKCNSVEDIENFFKNKKIKDRFGVKHSGGEMYEWLKMSGLIDNFVERTHKFIKLKKKLGLLGLPI